jgi:hypothetical protein
MTRKDYILIANALREALTDGVGGANENEKEGIHIAASHLANALPYDNPRFNSEHFLSVVRGEKDLNSKPARRRA